MRKYMPYILCSTLLVLASTFTFAEKYKTVNKPVNDKFIKKYGRSFFDVKNINPFPIPHVLDRIDNKGKITTAQEWNNIARPQILNFYDEQVYGAIPPRPDSINFELLESSKDALGGIAERRQYRITVSAKYGSRDINVLFYLPKGATKDVPTFVYTNFAGNYAMSPEEEVFRIEPPKTKGKNLKRGRQATRLPIADIVARGFAVATHCYEDLYPDDKSQKAFKQSIYQIFANRNSFPQGGAISAWAWGNMRVMDLLQTIPELDKQKIAIVGHSRLGKTAILTGVHDKRFAYIIANNSGCMGDALSKRYYGESLGSMVKINFPYWFMPALAKYADNEGELPLDQHHLLATIAPRMLYTTSTTKDEWADPEGQLLGLINACPAFALFGAKNFPTLDALEIEKPFHGDVAYHIRRGKHSITPYDWNNFMDYAQKRGWKPVLPKK
ncbi:MAG: hypothetical protein E7036_05800 [Opitutales bacterium]|nr:hypothetical protein [Opitutales bacterium]